MDDQTELYQQIILKHYKKPANRGTLPEPSVRVEAHNALCGDAFTIYVNQEGNRIAQARFEGAGCAISQASASMMTELILGKTHGEVAALTARMRQMVAANQPEPAPVDSDGDLAAFLGVRAYPMRAKCALLVWNALDKALSSEDE